MKKIINPYRNLICMLFFAGILFISCHPAAKEDTAVPTVPIVPVQVSTVASTSLSEFTELTAVSAFLQKSYVKANMTGYVQLSNVQLGKQVSGRQILFTLITKEARAIGDDVNKLDPTFKFSGISQIRADQSGIISLVNHQKGDYVQDGEALAEISNTNSLVFLLNLPYELRWTILNNQILEVLLPGGEKLKGTLDGSLPVVDSAAQTQKMIVRAISSHAIPAGLIAKIKITTAARLNTQTLPKSAVLANETEDEFWVMKLINDSTAVKVLIKKGIENNKDIEILKPIFGLKDRIVTAGNYGMADMAKVKIVK